MLIVPEASIKKKIEQEREQLRNHFNVDMEKILNENAKHDKYWILGKVRFPEEFVGKVGRTFLQACLEKPGLVKNAFLYEVDNRKGTKELLWVMHPDDTLRLPGLNKTIRVTPTSRAKFGA